MMRIVTLFITGPVILYSPLKKKWKKENKSSGCQEKNYRCESPPVTRSKTSKTDWKQWIFCQTDQTDKSLRQVMSKNMDQRIKDLAKYDYTLHSRVIDVGDLIAADVLYHSCCILNQIKNNLMKDVKEKDTCNSLPLLQIYKEF